jgi:hypothetical protein
MRQAINENRTVQLVLLGLLALAGGFILLKGKGGSEPTPAPPAATSPAGTAAPTDSGSATAPATDPTTGLPATDAAAGSSVVSTSAAVPANLVPGRGLPTGLMPAYRHNKAIVLLIRRAGGVDDYLVRAFVHLLGNSHFAHRVKVYGTKAKHIARYAWLTQGVDVTELPALVVLLPRKLSDGTPTATVSYGFRYPAGVLQAVKDALFNGPTRDYHP